MTSRKPLLLLSFAAVCLIWGSTYLVIRVALESFPPFLIGAVRFLGAGAVLLVMALVRGEPLPGFIQWRSALVTGGLFFVVGNGLVNVSEQSVSSGVVSVMVATMPLWATLFATLFGQRVTGREAAGVAIGLAGVVVMNLGGEMHGTGLGTVVGLLAPMGWALGSIASKRMRLPPGTMMRTAAQMLCGGGLMLGVSLAMGEHLAAPATLRTGAAVAYLCLFGSLAGFTAYSYLLRHTRPAVATSYAYVNPVIAITLGVAFGGERFGLASAAGSAIVLAAVALVGKARGGERPIAVVGKPLTGATRA